MKNKFGMILFSLAAMLFAASCEESPIDPLTGKYTAAVKQNMTTVVSHEVVKADDGTRTATLVLKDDAGDKASIDFIVTTYNITEGTYSASSARAKGKYLTATSTVTPAGGSAAAIQSGDINVTVTDDVNYSIDGIVICGSTAYWIKYSGSIEFEKDKVPSGYTYSIASAPVYIFNWTTFQNTLIPGVLHNYVTIADPDGNTCAMFDAIVNEKATTVAGTYTIAENAQVAGAMGNGYYLPAYNAAGGTYYLDGTTKMYVSSGTITIAFDDNGWMNITGKGLGTISGADASTGTKGAVAYSNMVDVNASRTTFAKVISASAQDHGDGNKIITIKLCEDAVSATYNPATYSYTYTGSGKYVSVDLISASDNIDRGDYTPAESTAAAKGNFIKGYDTEMWGTKFYNWGSVWGTVDNGTLTLLKVTDGKISVSNSGDNFVITGSLTLSDGTSSKFIYSGPLTGFTAAI
jgi:hypothetical protein